MSFRILKRRHAYKSKYNSKRENQVIHLMITDGKIALSCIKKSYLHCLKNSAKT